MSGVTPSADALFDGVPLEPTPSNRQGFGRLQLSNSLPLTSATRRLQAGADSGCLTPPNDSYRICASNEASTTACRWQTRC